MWVSFGSLSERYFGMIRVTGLALALFSSVIELFHSRMANHYFDADLTHILLAAFLIFGLEYYYLGVIVREGEY
ncbi:MAG: hypothetical protein HYT61_03250 [Candidatus Yanofskybacteria bacterium]|nr:hypothetical protein [Candidatus Yanofskybacteria bacterium]